MVYILSKLISKVFDIKDSACSFTLIFPFFTIGIEDTIAKEIHHTTMEFRTLDIIFEISYEENCLTTVYFLYKNLIFYSSRHVQHFGDRWYQYVLEYPKQTLFYIISLYVRFFMYKCFKFMQLFTMSNHQVE